jgi:nitroimidazol reductase NimA-like FMN-containing flavoprotein (pyridoxamine 5'-phosphate oxidase superfamily)
MEPTPRSTVRRLAELAAYDVETVEAVLDAGVVAHVGISSHGAPVVIPMAYARVGDTMYVHGSTASRVMRTLKTGDPICITVTIVDGIVLARSAFNMSMNYRSVVVHGRARLVADPEERMTAFRAIMDHLVPGHWNEVRPPNDIELRQTLVTAVKLDEVSAKVRYGPPDDEVEDLDLPVWAGEIPLHTVAGSPIADRGVPDGIQPPASVSRYARAFEATGPS